MDIAIKIENLHKTYRSGWRQQKKNEALRGVSLTITEGETFGFIGPNGAGKSTLIKILLGTLFPNSGSVSIFGNLVTEPKTRRGMGFVPESPSLPDYLTPLEILLMALRLHDVRLEKEKQHCLTWLERFGLGSVANQTIRSFSKGMMQRTVLAQAMAIKPRLLILDEPLSGLDPVGRKDVVDILDDYRKGGGTLFFSSHVLYDVERIADRFGLIHKGQLLTIRSPQEIAEDQQGQYLLRYSATTPITGSREVGTKRYEIQVEAEDLSKIISHIQEVNGILQDVRPAASLESVFFRAIAD